MQYMCHSCGVPLHLEEFKGVGNTYCKYCGDENGNLKKTKEEVQQAVAHWLKTWQPNINDQIALERAGHYVKAMPAWADK